MRSIAQKLSDAYSRKFDAPFEEESEEAWAKRSGRKKSIPRHKGEGPEDVTKRIRHRAEVRVSVLRLEKAY